MKGKKNNKSKDKQSINSDDLFEEIKQKEVVSISKFDMDDFKSKDQCTAYHFGKLPIEQKGYFCSVCDKKKKNIICRFCHSFCHDKCRETLIQDPQIVSKKEKLGPQKFSCHCGVTLKHTFNINNTSHKFGCIMMKLDQELDIPHITVFHMMLLFVVYVQLFAIMIAQKYLKQKSIQHNIATV